MLLRIFRNIAATIVAWYLYTFFGSLLAYATQSIFNFEASSDILGSLLLLHLTLTLPYAFVGVLAGCVVANAVKPKGDPRWGVFLAMLALASHLPSAAEWLQVPHRGPEDIVGVAAGCALIVAGVLFGTFIMRAQGPRAA